jgi:hypothetical protein
MRLKFKSLSQGPGSKPQFWPDEDGLLHIPKDFDWEEGQMKKCKGLGALLLAGFLVIPGNLGLAGQVLAQGEAKTEDKQLQELRQKRQEQWEEREREAKQLENTGKRKQDAVKRQQDAGQRQKAAEQRLRELDAEEK